MSERVEPHELEYLLGASIEFEADAAQLAGVHLAPGEELHLLLPVVLTGRG